MDEDYARKLRNWLQAEPGITPRGTSEERAWLREIPEPASAEAGTPPPSADDRWSVHGELPLTPADDDEWVCPVIALPVPRPSGENGCRMSAAEARSRRNHPTNAGRRAETPTAGPMSDAEARSRWNHPTNWHRRRREAEQQQQPQHQRDEPGSR